MKEIYVNAHGLGAMCRLCLAKNVYLLDIFYFSPTIGNHLSNIVMWCAPVQIRRLDEMPHWICRSCYTKLKQFYQFQTQILRSDKTLRRYVQQLLGSDKQIKSECSNQTSSEEHLIDKTNDCDVTVKYEPIEIHCIVGGDLDRKEIAPTNENCADKSTEDMVLKFEIKDEPTNCNSLIDDTVETAENDDVSEIDFEDSKVDLGPLLGSSVTECLNTSKDAEKNISVNYIFGGYLDRKGIAPTNENCADKSTEDMALKFEIKNEPTNCNSLIDDTVETAENDDVSEIDFEDSKVDLDPLLGSSVTECLNTSKEEKKNISVNYGNDQKATKKKYHGDICKTTFPNSRDLIRYKRTHTGEKPYQCDVCEKSFSSSSYLSTHKRTHTGEKPYQCDVCEKSFISSSQLTNHKRTHTGDKPYQCDVCKKSFIFSSQLTYHKRTHTGDKPYQCDVCNRRFSHLNALNYHQRTHTGVKPYQCDVCKKSFISSSHLINHKRTHTGDKPYQCDVCSKCFNRSGSLNNHKRTHTGVKPYQCEVCNRRFIQIAHLNYHKRTHTGEKPYQCDVCKKSFSTSCYLTNHKRTHTGEKPYQCDVCNRCFIHINTLNYHTRLHTGEKPYQCDVCSKCFNRSESLNNHKRRHTGEKPY